MPKHPLLLQSQQRAKTIAFILLSGEVILLYSRCAKKGLVYIAIAAPSSHQPSSYSKYTSTNMRSSCDVRSVSNTKYIFHIRRRLRSSHSNNGNTQCLTALLALLYTL